MLITRAGIWAVLSFSLVACSGGAIPDEDVGATTQSVIDAGATVLAVLPGDEFAPVVASRRMESGNEIRVYDYAGGALVLETGAAYSPPSYRPPPVGERRSLLDLWAAIAPNEAPPAALEDLQLRLEYREGGPDAPRTLPPEPRDAITVVEQTRKTPRSGGPTMFSPEGCNNGCCDYDWMYNNFWQCNEDYDFDWMLYNYRSERVNSTIVWLYDGYVCSADGTSKWHFNLGSAKSVDIDIPQATYAYDWWIAPVNPWPWGGSFYDEDLQSSVNVTNGGRLHTYCGGVEHD